MYILQTIKTEKKIKKLSSIHTGLAKEAAFTSRDLPQIFSKLQNFAKTCASN